MIFQQSPIDLIKVRSSQRSYTRQEIEPEVRKKLSQYLAQPHKGFFGNNVRFYFVEKPDSSDEEKFKPGTYGFIKGARYFIVGVIKEAAHVYEDFGYLFEEVILLATDLNLGTCWLGGTFDRDKFAKLLGLQKEGFIPAITPVGYVESDLSMRDRIIRIGAGSKNRKPWDELFFEGDFSKPLDEKIAEKYSLPLEMVRWAPSASNKQPWRIVKETGRHDYHFFLRRTPGYFRPERRVDLQKIDMGIAIYHFETVAHEVKLHGRWDFRLPEKMHSEKIEYIISWISD